MNITERGLAIAVIIYTLLIAATTAVSVWAIVVNHNNTVAIQHQRREACQDSNMRHARTVARFDAGLRLAARNASPARQAQLRQSRDFTVGLIDALAPVRDCKDLTR